MNTKIKGILHLLKYRTKLYFKGVRKYDLLIYDDFFPNPLNGYRLDEFNFLLGQFKNSGIIIDSTKSYRYFGFTKENKQDHLDLYTSKYGKKDSVSRIKYASKLNNINSKVVYVVFYFNLMRIYKFLEIFRIPFIFTLYPGGGFVIDDSSVDKELKRALKSPLCKAVIVNQNFTKKYLLERGLCDESKIRLIFGLPIAGDKLHREINDKKYFPDKKKCLDICFAGNKYIPQGRDKGYDIFIETAKLLSKQFDFLQFHVIGNFDETDMDVSTLNDRISFYGRLNSEDLNKTLIRFEMIISPNRPFILVEGAFDGFPLGTCVEASLVGCCVVTSDRLNENKYYEEDREIIIIEPEVNSIIKRLIPLIKNPDRIIEIGKAGRIKTQILYSEEIQLRTRVEIIKEIISINK